MEYGNDYGDQNYDDAQPEPRSNQLARRDFSGIAIQTEGAATQALVAKARADIEARWIMAMRRPRNPDDVRQMIMKECRRPGFAKAATYSVPRGGKAIVGLSIRFAEVAARCMGNMPIEVQTIYDSDSERIVRVTVTDLETNTTYSRDLTIKKTVERKQLARGQRPLGERTNSYGDRVFIVQGTDDDVAVKEAAMVSKAMRTLILRLIPGHIQDEAEALCIQIARDQAAKDPDGERVRMLDAFASLAIYPSDLEVYLGHTTERLAPAELEYLRGIYRAIADGETTWTQVLEDKPKAKATDQAPAAAAPATSAQPAQGTTSTTPVQQPAATQPAPAQSKPSTRAKGTAALKDKLTDKPAAPGPVGGNPTSAFDNAAANARARDAEREQRKADDAMTEPAWMSGSGRYAKGAKLGPADVTEDTPPPADGSEYRGCAGCGVLIEVPTDTPDGAQCYTCRQA